MDLRLTPVVKRLLIVYAVAAFLGLSSLGGWLAKWLAYSSTEVLHFEWWRILSYPVLIFDGNTWLWSSLFLWWFGVSVERSLGERRFLEVFFGSALVGALVATLLALFGFQSAMAGPTIPGFAITILFGWLFPHATIYLMFLIPVRAWVVSALACLVQLMMFVGDPTSPIVYATVAGGLFAWALVAGRLPKLGTSRRRPSRPRKEPPSEPAEVISLDAYRRENRRESRKQERIQNQEAEVDKILAKVSKDGMSALTPEEKASLDRHSRLLRSRDGD